MNHYMHERDMPLPLAGVRIIEMTHMVMGPTCGLILADLGAEVIKIEPPGTPERPGDPTRYLLSTGAGFFAACNRNKKSVILDLKTAAGREAAHALIKSADVFLENFRPGALESCGMDYGTLNRLNPRLIYCSLKGFLDGPYDKRTALDEVVQMLSGLAYMTGPPGRPLRAGAPVNDMMGGMFGAIAVMAAIRQREVTGRGQHVKSGLFENAAWLVSTHMLQGQVSGSAPVPMPAGKRAWGVYDIFQSSDGVGIFIGVVTDRQWEIFVDMLDAPHLQQPQFATNRARSMAREELIPMVGELIGKYSFAEIERMCEAAGLPFARINQPGDLYTDSHLAARGGLLPIRLQDGRDCAVPGLPIQFEDMRLGVRLDIPQPGEHTEELLAGVSATPT
jgi:crotonobetainyl-CoA:carnitine CoA-transferase CaiB-like acyl-CoA transferase